MNFYTFFKFSFSISSSYKSFQVSIEGIGGQEPNLLAHHPVAGTQHSAYR